MADKDSESLSLFDAASRFLAQLPPQEQEASQQEVYRFVRWYGRERILARLTAHEVAKYAEQLSLSDTDHTKKLEQIRAFLSYAKKAGWSKTNLATHLKARKAKTGAKVTAKQNLPKTVSLTRQRFEELEAELVDLKRKRHELIDEIRKAAADKDFRENAPLAAAREQRGHVEGRIREVEETLKATVIIDNNKKAAFKAVVGDKVVLCDLASGEELRYMIVDPREVDPTKGKISIASPLGKALIGRAAGDIIKVTVPAGKMRYELKHIEH